MNMFSVDNVVIILDVVIIIIATLMWFLIKDFKNNDETRSQEYSRSETDVFAIEWTGLNFNEVVEFTEFQCRRMEHTIIVSTLDGEFQAYPGDMIVKTLEARVFVCNKALFGVLTIKT